MEYFDNSYMFYAKIYQKSIKYNDQANNSLIHFYKRFQIKSGFTRSLGGPNQVLEQAPGIPGTSAVQWD